MAMGEIGGFEGFPDRAALEGQRLDEVHEDRMGGGPLRRSALIGAAAFDQGVGKKELHGAKQIRELRGGLPDSSAKPRSPEVRAAETGSEWNRLLLLIKSWKWQ